MTIEEVASLRELYVDMGWSTDFSAVIIEELQELINEDKLPDDKQSSVVKTLGTELQDRFNSLHANDEELALLLLSFANNVKHSSVAKVIEQYISIDVRTQFELNNIDAKLVQIYNYDGAAGGFPSVQIKISGSAKDIISKVAAMYHQSKYDVIPLILGDVSKEVEDYLVSAN